MGTLQPAAPALDPPLRALQKLLGILLATTWATAQDLAIEASPMPGLADGTRATAIGEPR